MQECLNIDRYRVSDLDAAQYQITCIITAIIIYAGYFLFVTGSISSLILFIAIALILPRWLINVHELFHIKNIREVKWFIALMIASPVPVSVISQIIKIVNLNERIFL